MISTQLYHIIMNGIVNANINNPSFYQNIVYLFNKLFYLL